MDSKNDIIIRFNKLVTKNKLIAKFLSRKDTKNSNKVNITKKPSFRNKVIVEV